MRGTAGSDGFDGFGRMSIVELCRFVVLELGAGPGPGPRPGRGRLALLGTIGISG